MTADPVDVGLLDALAAGDATAFPTLVERHGDLVFAVCLRILGDRDLALDATQETFLTLFRRAGSFRRESKLSTWLYRVAVNASLDIDRRRRRHLTAVLPEGHDPPDPAAADELAAVELRPALEEALAAIPVELRAAVVLVDALDLGLTEVADILGVPVGTVKSRVFRARRHLARLLGDPPGNRGGPGRRPMEER